MKKKRVRKSNVKQLPAPRGSDVGSHKIMRLPKGAHVEIEPTALIMAAITHKTDMSTIKDLMELRDRINRERAEKEYRAAMAKFQAECPIIVKSTAVLNKDEKTTRYKYAAIDKIIEVVKPILQKHGFSYQIKSETISQPFAGIKAIAIAHHLGGHSEQSEFSTPIDEKAYMTLPQIWLSAQSFARRIAFCNLFGIMTGEADVDGNKIIGNITTGKKEKSEKTTVDEATKKIDSLPDYIKEGFKHLDYTKAKVIYDFCSKFEWNNATIKKEIEKIIAAREGAK
jgi:ERF superfamily